MGDDDDIAGSGGEGRRGILASIEEKMTRRRLSSSGMVARSSSSSFPRTIIGSETSREGRTTRPNVEGGSVGTTSALTLGKGDVNERCDVGNSSSSNDDGLGLIAIFGSKKNGMSG
jgi:hypothetical protein